MAGSMFDQLKKAGLVDKNKAKQIKKEKYQQNKNKHSKKQKAQGVVSESAELALKARQEQVDKNQKINLERKIEQERKELQAQCVQIIQSQQLKDIAGEEEFSFADGTAVKTLNLELRE